MSKLIPVVLIALIAVGIASYFLFARAPVEEKNDTTVDEAFLSDLNALLADIDSVNVTDYELADLEITDDLNISFE